MRAYTVRELDALRQVVERKWLWGTYNITPQNSGPGYGMSRCYREEEKSAAVEAMVRTHMTAGHTAEDLLQSERSREESANKLSKTPESGAK